MTRCRVSEEDKTDPYFDGAEDITDPYFDGVTVEDEREAAREDIETLAADIQEVVWLLLKDKKWQPDSDDIESAEALYRCLTWHMTPAQREAV